MERQTLNFCRNLATACKEYGSISALAEKSGVTNVFLSKIINGHSTPSIDTAVKIANALGLTLDELTAPPKEFAKISA